MYKVNLSKRHLTAVNKKRSLIQHIVPFADFSSPLMYKNPGYVVNAVFNDGFNNIDIDTICWDFADGGCGSCIYKSSILPDMHIKNREISNAKKSVAALIEKTKKTGAEVFWNHRMNGAEGNPGAEKYECVNRFKKEHPNWIIKNWWWQGFWNYEYEGLRNFKLSIIEEIVTNYDVDGIQLDFLRDIPVLPPGRQWSLRECISRFVFDVRIKLMEVSKNKNKPVLLAVRVPENINGCRMDGLDVKKWSALNLVDFFVLGGRTVDVDIDFFKNITRGKSIKIYPCLDGNHPVLGYYKPSEEFLNGTFYNWVLKGADGVQVFDWGFVPEKLKEDKSYECSNKQLISQNQLNALDAFTHIGKLSKKAKVYALDRKGGYPWATGYGCRNDFAKLPQYLNDEENTFTTLNLKIYEGKRGILKNAELHVIFSGAYEQDKIEMFFNGIPIENVKVNHHHRDTQVLPYTPPSNCYQLYKRENSRRLSIYRWTVPGTFVKAGINTVSLKPVKRDRDKEIVIEKVEFYNPGVN